MNDPFVKAAVRELAKAETKVKEARAQLKATVQTAVSEERITSKEAAAVTARLKGK